MNEAEKKSTIYVFLAWLGIIVLAGIGALVASFISAAQDDHRNFGSGLSFIFYDLIIFTIAAIQSYRIPLKIGIEKSGNRQLTLLQVSTLFCILAGMLLGLIAWSAPIGKSTLYPALGIAAIVEISLYFVLSMTIYFRLRSRYEKYLVSLIQFTLLIIPGVILRAISSI